MSPKQGSKAKTGKEKEKDKAQKTRNERAEDASSAPTEDSASKEAGASKGVRVQTLRGMRDVLPEEMGYWEAVAHAAEAVAQAYRFDRIIVPLLESARLFTRSVGEATDIVEKEMYTFQDRSNEDVALRPEFTASIARAYSEHGMHNRPQPVRLWEMGPAFRYDRPQAGRYRQFWQANYEVIGDAHPVIDAQLIAASATLYRKLGIPFLLQINSIGDAACRPNFIRTLTEYLRSRTDRLCEDCQRRTEQNPLRVLDCAQALCRETLVDAPQIVDWLCDACRDHFIKVLEYLDEMEIPYQLESRLVRGLDYYTRTTFEVVLRAEEGQQGALEGEGAQVLGGGGRYDRLLEIIGGRATPAIGFAAGIERMILAMQRVGAAPVRETSPQVFLAQLGNDARKMGLRLCADLRTRGFTVAEQFSKDGLSAQLESAAKLGCRYTLILGQKELMDGTIIIRDMESGIQEIVDFSKVSGELEKRLSPRVATPPVSAASVAQTATALLQETQRIDLKREEYLLRETVVETEVAAPAPAEEAEGGVAPETEEGEAWEEEGDGPRAGLQAGLSWVSKDYADDQFDE